MFLIVGIINPAKMWQTFEDIFEQKSNAWHLIQKTNLTTRQLEEEGLIVDYLKQLKDFTNQLANIGEVVWEDESIEQLVSILMNYETLTNTLIYCAKILNFN